MGTPFDARGGSARRQLFLNADVLRREFDEAVWAFCTTQSHIGAERLARLSQAIAEKDRAAADKILRGWGIRR